MVNVIQRRERFDDLAVGLILFQLGAAYGERHGEYAQPRTGIRLIRLNIVDAKAQPPAHGDEVAQIAAVFELQMDLKMIGAVFQILLKRRKARENAQEKEKHDPRDRVQPRADRKAENAARPKARGGREALDLAARAEENGVAAHERCGDDGRRRENGKPRAEVAHQVYVEQHGYRGGEYCSWV